MSRYTGPKGRINRRLGAMIFESAGAAKAFDRRPNAPGMAPPVRKISTFGESMDWTRGERGRVRGHTRSGEDFDFDCSFTTD